MYRKAESRWNAGMYEAGGYGNKNGGNSRAEARILSEASSTAEAQIPLRSKSIKLNDRGGGTTSEASEAERRKLKDHMTVRYDPAIVTASFASFSWELFCGFFVPHLFQLRRELASTVASENQIFILIDNAVAVAFPSTSVHIQNKSPPLA
ncbi:hypothetical protein BDR05DRAFT_998122 [Suillus weaverae]|nr:hypothetical protein BDR05DRAFT_998122 [Suillus weaverae]